MIRKFRKKPVVIKAMQFDGTFHNAGELAKFIGHTYDGIIYSDDKEGNLLGLMIRTLEGQVTASVGDWIIKGVAGEFYPCKPDIFEATYEEVKEGNE